MIKGLQNIKQVLSKSTEYLKLKDGESSLIKFVVSPEEIISVYEHVEFLGGQWRVIPCLGQKECPLCQAGKKASFRVYIPVLDIGADKIKIFKVSRETAKLIIGLWEEYGKDFNEMTFKVVRNGEKFNTTYQFFPKDKSSIDLSKYEIPNIEDLIKIMTKEEIEVLLETDGVTESQEDTDGDNGFPF